jgi:hypothetical protein
MVAVHERNFFFAKWHYSAGSKQLSFSPATTLKRGGHFSIVLFVCNRLSFCQKFIVKFNHVFNLHFGFCAVLYYVLAGPPGAARDYITISLWKSPVQIDLRDQGKKIRRAIGWVLNEAGLPTHHRGQLKWEAPDKFQDHCSKANTPFGVGGPCGPRGEVSPQK